MQDSQGETTASTPFSEASTTRGTLQRCSPTVPSSAEGWTQAVPQRLEVELALTGETKQLVCFQMPIRALADTASENPHHCIY